MHNDKRNAFNEENTYQPIRPNLILYQQQRNNHFQANPTNIIMRQLSDSDYFSNLKHYKPLFYSGSGTPFFLFNEVWCHAFSCVLFIDLILTISLVMFVITGKEHQSKQQIHYSQSSSSNDTTIIIISSCVSLIVINISYFFCQFMNPGVENMTVITQEQYEQKGKRFCQQCNQYRTEDMSHCKECQVCIWGLDHHCGFFDKCIAGWQKWAFYTFLTSLFCAFLLIIICLGMILTFY